MRSEWPDSILMDTLDKTLWVARAVNKKEFGVRPAHQTFISHHLQRTRSLLQGKGVKTEGVTGMLLVFFLIDVVACGVYSHLDSTQIYTYSPDVAQFKIKCTLVEGK